MRPYNRAAVLIVDPHGEYNTLQEIANAPEFREDEPATRAAARRSHAMQARTRVYLHDQVKVRMTTLTLGDLRYLLPNMTDKQHHFLGRAYRGADAGQKKGQPWTAADLKRRVSNVGKAANEDSGDDSGNSTVAALSWKIDERLERQ